MVLPINEAAKDLWSQVFAREAQKPGAALVDPSFDEAEDKEKLRAGYAKAGWSQQEIDTLIASAAKHHSEAPNTSPGTSRGAEAFHNARCNAVEEEMERQGLASQKSVARGIDPRVGPYASKIGVILTDQSVITAGTFTYRFCGLIAKAFVRTLLIDPGIWASASFTARSGLKLILSRPDLMTYWREIFTSFAVAGNHGTVPFIAASKSEVWHVEQVALALEIFVIAHEYGHHHLGHGRDVESDPAAEEFAADQFALRIGRPIGEREASPIWNPYLASGAGGVIVLKALGILRAYEIAFGGELPNNYTHPDIDERINRFDSVGIMKPAEFQVLKGFRVASLRVLDAIACFSSEMLGLMPNDLRQAMKKVRDEMRRG